MKRGYQRAKRSFCEAAAIGCQAIICLLFWITSVFSLLTGPMIDAEKHTWWDWQGGLPGVILSLLVALVPSVAVWMLNKHMRSGWLLSGAIDVLLACVFFALVVEDALTLRDSYNFSPSSGTDLPFHLPLLLLSVAALLFLTFSRSTFFPRIGTAITEATL